MWSRTLVIYLLAAALCWHVAADTSPDIDDLQVGLFGKPALSSFLQEVEEAQAELKRISDFLGRTEIDSRSPEAPLERTVRGKRSYDEAAVSRVNLDPRVVKTGQKGLSSEDIHQPARTDPKRPDGQQDNLGSGRAGINLHVTGGYNQYREEGVPELPRGEALEPRESPTYKAASRGEAESSAGHPPLQMSGTRSSPVEVVLSLSVEDAKTGAKERGGRYGAGKSLAATAETVSLEPGRFDSLADRIGPVCSGSSDKDRQALGDGVPPQYWIC